MTFDGSLHVLIAECRKLANELSAENLDVPAAYVHKAILKLRKALSAQAVAELESREKEALARLNGRYNGIN